MTHRPSPRASGERASGRAGGRAYITNMYVTLRLNQVHNAVAMFQTYNRKFQPPCDKLIGGATV